MIDHSGKIKLGFLSNFKKRAGGVHNSNFVPLHLNFLGELGGFDLDECGIDGAHEGLVIVESDAARANRIFVLVRVHP